MSKKISKWSMVPAVLGFLMTPGVMTVFHACGRKDDGTWMHCHAAQQGTAVMGIVIFVLFLLAALIKNRVAALLLSAAGIAACVVAMLIPGRIMPMCMMSTMRCHTVMQPFVQVVSVLTIITAVINILFMRKGGDRS